MTVWMIKIQTCGAWFWLTVGGRADQEPGPPVGPHYRLGFATKDEAERVGTSLKSTNIKASVQEVVIDLAMPQGGTLC
jgi:hypothetical protein